MTFDNVSLSTRFLQTLSPEVQQVVDEEWGLLVMMSHLWNSLSQKSSPGNNVGIFLVPGKYFLNLLGHPSTLCSWSSMLFMACWILKIC